MAELSLKGKVLPAELREFFDIKNISEAGGSADADLTFSGRVDFKKKFGFAELIDLKTEGNINFNSFTIGLNDNKILLKDVKGSLT